MSDPTDRARQIAEAIWKALPATHEWTTKEWAELVSTSGLAELEEASARDKKHIVELLERRTDLEKQLETAHHRLRESKEIRLGWARDCMCLEGRLEETQGELLLREQQARENKERLEAAERKQLIAEEIFRVHTEANQHSKHCVLCKVERERDEARDLLREWLVVYERGYPESNYAASVAEDTRKRLATTPEGGDGDGSIS
jgi:hypothetical protein